MILIYMYFDDRHQNQNSENNLAIYTAAGETLHRHKQHNPELIFFNLEEHFHIFTVQSVLKENNVIISVVMSVISG